MLKIHLSLRFVIILIICLFFDVSVWGRVSNRSPWSRPAPKVSAPKAGGWQNPALPLRVPQTKNEIIEAIRRVIPDVLITNARDLRENQVCSRGLRAVALLDVWLSDFASRNYDRVFKHIQELQK